MKQLIRIAAIISMMAMVPAMPALAKDAWNPTIPAPISSSYMQDYINGDHRVVLDEGDLYEAATSKIQVNIQEDSNTWSSYVCDSVTTGKCDTKDKAQVVGTSLLPICNGLSENCIESVSIYKEGEQPVAAKFVRNLPGYTFAADPSIGLPAGSTKSIWEAATVEHGGGNKNYAAAATFSWTYSGGRVIPTKFAMAVSGIAEKPNQMAQVPKMSNCVRPHDQSKGTCQNSLLTCFYTLDGICGTSQDFAEATRIGVTLKLSNEIAGWFKGRLKDPIYNVTPIDSKMSLVSIDAQPVSIPKLFATYRTSKGDPDVDMAVRASGGNSGGSVDNTWTNHYSAASEGGLVAANLLRTQSKDIAAGLDYGWSFETIATGGASCLNDKSRLLGLVTTNAMAYSGGVPEWDGKSLTYRVAGMHYLPDGNTPAEGSYDLVMRSDVARCLYGFSKAPISATINVTGAGGETKTATTIVSEKDGWLKLAAYGFTFSSPTISVKLSQAKTPAVKTTITCVKGKLTKKVTAVGPKCPAGYKKK
jgi:hypothetical protein